MTALVDTHAHLADSVLSDDLDEVLKRAQVAGVVQVVAIGTTAADSAEVVALSQGRDGVFAAVGIHPNNAAEAKPGDWEQIVALIGQPRVVAVGETGLDRYRVRTPFDEQREWFERHLDLAKVHDLPVVIHCRNSERDIFEQLANRRRPIKGVLHSFTGTWEDAQAFLELGLHLSFAGMLTFGNKALDALRESVARVPLDRLLTETDSPYLSPHPFRGQTNEPARVAVTAERLAQLRGLTLAELARSTTANARRLFGLRDDDIL